MVNYNQEVLVKTKVWHKRFTQGMASPYYTAKVKGPSPMMSHGWVVQDKEGKIQHARAVLVPDSRADEVVLEFEAANPGPGHRLIGKQSPDPRLRIPLPVLMSKGAMREPEDEESEPQDQPLPPIGADLSSLQHRETDSHETEEATVSAETGMAQTHARTIGEEGQKKETHRDEATSVPGEPVSQLQMASLAAGGESLEFCFANGHEKRRDEGLQREHRDLQGEPCRGRRDLQEGLETCNGCGLLQVASKGKCG